MGALRTLGCVVAAGGGLLAYAVGFERTAYTLRRARVPVLAPGAPPLQVLHLSDLHMTPNQCSKQEWLRELARFTPDLIVLTGDVLSHPDADRPTLRALEPLFAFLGACVPGN